MDRHIAEYFISTILSHMKVLKPYVNRDMKEEWEEAMQIVESLVFVELKGDEEYG